MNQELKIGLDLADRICQVVRPNIGIRTKKLTLTEISGDYQYPVDEGAEELIKKYFENLWKKGINYGFVTEDQGLVLPPSGHVEKIFEIDPVDGSRPAQRGMGTSCCVISIVTFKEKTPTLADIEIGIVRPILENASYVGIPKTGEVFRIENNKKNKLNLSQMNDLKQAFIDVETYAAPTDLMGIVYHPLVNSVNAHFVYHAISYSLLSVARGETEGTADIRLRIYKDFPSVREKFWKPLKTSAALDICGVYPIIKGVGGVITDGYGKSLDSIPLWSFDEKGNWTKETNVSCIVANNQNMHTKILEKIEEGIEDLRKLTLMKNVRKYDR
jgi:fructose-1,6-bisphosphatase/inositol monophosphatase family enzyme